MQRQRSRSKDETLLQGWRRLKKEEGSEGGNESPLSTNVDTLELTFSEEMSRAMTQAEDRNYGSKNKDS